MKNFTYDIVARIFPALLCSLPFFALYYFFLNKITPDFLKFIFGLRYDYVSIIIILTFLMSQICRFIGKFIFQKTYFKDERNFPTTVFLLEDNGHYSRDFKNKVREKIISDFNIDIYKDDNGSETVKRIMEAVSLVREKVKDGRLLLAHNMEYGFWRNFIGGAVFAGIISIFNLAIFYFYGFNKVAFIFSLVLLIAYSLLLLFSKSIIKNLGENYAEILFKEYLA